jgi:hypothetical protein
MAIGKVNAYATVDAPKADFGAVAQLNIDNLVKSAKEDEQLKVAKKAAADKAKSEREKDLKLFPNVTATGATAVDTFYLQQSKKDFDLSNQYKRDWIENNNYESKAKYESLVHHYGDMNNQLASFGTQVTKFSEKAGDGKSLYKKNAEHGMDIVKSMNENRLRISRDDNGNVKFGIYKEEGGEMVLDKVVDQATYYRDINNPVPNIDIDADAKATKGVYEKDFIEKYSGRTKTGIKELSEDAKKKIYEDCLSKVNDDNFAYVAGDTYEVIAKDDFKRSGFDKTEKESIARKHADKIIGMFGREETKDTTFFAPKDGGGSGSKVKTPLTLTTLTDADFYGNKDEQGNNLDNYAKGAKSKVLSGISGTEPKSAKYIIPSFEMWSANNKEGVAKPTGKILTDYVVDKLMYDNKGRPTVSGNYIDIKSRTYKKAKDDLVEYFKGLRTKDNSQETDTELEARAESELSLNSEAYGIERVNHVQQIGKVEEQDLIAYLIANKGRINGVKIKDVSSVKRAMGYNQQKFDYEKYYQEQKSKK